MKFSPQVKQYLSTQEVGRIATATLEGKPHLTAISYINDEKQVYLLTMTKSKKVRNIKKNNKISFIVDDTPPPKGWRYVIIEGTAEPVSDTGIFERLLKLIYSKYPAMEGAYSIDQNHYSIIAIQPEKVLTANL